MSRKKCNRKVWASVGFDAVAHGIAGARITSKIDCDKLLLSELCALEAMTRGNGTRQEWAELNGCLTLCAVAANRHGVGLEAIQACTKAQQALTEAFRRAKDTGRMGLSGEGIQALRDVIEWHDLQRRSIPRSQYELIIRDALNLARIKKVAA